MKKVSDMNFWRRLAMALLLLLILIRPTISSEESKRKVLNVNLWFVVDATGSMVAKDVENGAKRRFEKVQEDVEAVVAALPGAKYGMVVQDFTSYVAVPMSYSSDAVIAGPVMPKRSLYAQATDLSSLLQLTTEKITAYKKSFPERKNVVIVMSDGENLTGNEIEVPRDLAKLIEGAFVFGYGSEEGSMLERIALETTDGSVATAISETDYIWYIGDRTDIEVGDGFRVISKIDERALKTIASSINGEYYHRESGGIPESAIKKYSRYVAEQEDGSPKANVGAELYWIFALLLMGLLLWEIEEMVRNVRLERSEEND